MKDCKIKKKLTVFLNEKMKEILNLTRDANHSVNLYHIRPAKGFDKSETHNSLWGDGYNFFNDNGCQCHIYLRGGKWNKYLISIVIDDYSSSGWYGTTEMLYLCMDEINKIAKEFRKLKGDLEKQEKIGEIALNSITAWLKTIMQNQQYSYYTTESENKIMLSIKIKNRMQLDIPIYYYRFQKMMPELLETIQQFEKTVNKSKIKVLISNSEVNQQRE